MNIPKYTSTVLLTALLSCCLPAQGNAQWTNDKSINTPVCTVLGAQSGVRIVSDESRGVILAWDDYRGGTNSNVYLQRLNRNGVPQWTTDGIPLYSQGAQQTLVDIFSDGAGGAIVGWIDSRSGSPTAYLQRINSAGLPQWVAGGVAVVQAATVTLAKNASGDSFIAWSSAGDIYAQKVSIAGIFQWASSGVVVCNDTTSQSQPFIASDGEGGAVVAWKDGRRGLWGSIFAQSLASNGTAKWTLNGSLADTAVYPHFTSTGIVVDSVGYAIILWKVSNIPYPPILSLQPLNEDTYYLCTGMSSTGGRWWSRVVGNGRQEVGRASIISDGYGGAVITTNYHPIPIDYQLSEFTRINPAGNGVWFFRTDHTTYPCSVSDEQGVVMNAWQDNRSGSADVYAQRINASGVGEWGYNGTPISTATGDQRIPQLCSDGAGGAIVAWEDYRSGTTSDIYAQSIDRFGKFSSASKMYLRDNGGEIDSLEYGMATGATDGIDAAFGEYELPPLPPTGVFDVRWQITGTQGTKLDVRDTLGGTRTQVIYRGLMQPSDPPGGYPFTLKWNRSEFPTGTFTLRDEVGGSSFVVDMKHQDSLVITDPNIVSFRIIHDRRPTQKLFIRDISERADSLEYGTAEGATDSIDWLFGESELPPLPPTGVFDVRWKITGTQGTKLDVRDTLGGTRTQAIYRGLIQPSDPPGGYPFTLKWNKSEFPAGTFTLRDAPGGTRFAVDMKQQDSVVITDSDIASFQIIFDRRPAFYCAFQQGWNIMSLPLTVDDRRKNWLFTGSNSNAFAYLPSGYVVRDTLQNGIGYWLKFPSAQDIGITGTVRMRDTVAVAVGWNMIGAIADSVDVTTIQQIPPTIIASQIYGYNAGYSVTTMLLPSRGYWVKTIASGLLILSSASGLNKGALSPSYALDRAATITISDSRVATQTLCFTSELIEKKDLDFFELPPPPPAGTFNARFSTNRVLEAVKEGESKMIPIQISDAQYPLTIRWEMKDQSLTASLMIGTTEVPMSSNGSVTVSDSKAPISLKLGGYSSLPKEFALFQNYPNPFNPSTTIKYDLPKDSRVSLKLFNILGQEVATLVNEEQKAGYRSVQWNANNVASGVYFYRIQAGEFVSTKRLLLLK